MTKHTLFKLVFNPDFYALYIANYFAQWETLEKILRQFDFSDLLEAITACYPYFNHWHKNFVNIILESLHAHCCVDADEYDTDLMDIINHNTIHREYGIEVDTISAADDLITWVEESLTDEIAQSINLLPPDFSKDNLISFIDIDVSNAEAVIESYIQSSYEDDNDNYHVPSNAHDYTAIDAIFDR